MDETGHAAFLNAFPASMLSWHPEEKSRSISMPFGHCLSKAAGATQGGRLTNLTQLNAVNHFAVWHAQAANTVSDPLAGVADPRMGRTSPT